MSKITRYDGDVKPFASSSQGTERTIFGEVTQSDELTDQITTSFLRGWGIVGPNENPSLQDFSAAMFTSTKFISYLHQMGVAEWNATQEYPTEGSAVVHSGSWWKRGASWSLGDEPGISSNWIENIDSKSIGEVVIAENYLKGNQNWNAQGSIINPLPSATPTTYTAGSDIADGIEAFTTASDIVYVGGILKSNSASGIIRHKYKKDPASNLSKTNMYAAVIKDDGVQVDALIDSLANGTRITDDSNYIYVDVDLSFWTLGYRYVGLSKKKGVFSAVNDEESLYARIEYLRDRLTWQDFVGVKSSGLQYAADESVDNEIYVRATGATATVEITTEGKTFSSANNASGAWAHVGITIKRGQNYTVTVIGTIAEWNERRLS